MTKIFFATDLHGSEPCFKKFLRAGTFYGADILFLGGDYGAKELVLFSNSEKGVDTFSGSGQHQHFASTDDFDRYVLWCKASGRLMKRVDASVLQHIAPASYHDLFDRTLNDTFATWAEMARDAFRRDGIPIYVIPGNDDSPRTDHYFTSEPFVFMHRRTAELRASLITLLGWGGSNPTPWHTPREYPEHQIRSELEQALKLRSHAGPMVLLAHPPPFGCGLDLVPEITKTLSYRLSFGSSAMVPIGSSAVREFVEEHQPLIGLFGHVHEGRGYHMIGQTLCINPGSAFHTGRLLGCILSITDGRVDDFQLTDG